MRITIKKSKRKPLAHTVEIIDSVTTYVDVIGHFSPHEMHSLYLQYCVF